MKSIKLYKLEKDLKKFIALFIIALTLGVSLGLYYLFQTTSFSKENISQRYGSSEIIVDEDFGIPEQSGKSLSEVLMTIHNHIISFSIFFFIVGILFYFNSVVDGILKKIVLFEPMFSIVISFGSILGMKVISGNLVYLTIISAVLMYFCFYFMVTVIIYELLIKQK